MQTRMMARERSIRHHAMMGSAAQRRGRILNPAHIESVRTHQIARTALIASRGWPRPPAWAAAVQSIHSSSANSWICPTITILRSP